MLGVQNECLSALKKGGSPQPTASVLAVTESLLRPLLLKRFKPKSGTFSSYQDRARFIRDWTKTLSSCAEVERKGGADEVQRYCNAANSRLLLLAFHHEENGKVVKPPLPEGPPLYFGRIHRYIMRHVCRGDVPLMYSLQKGSKQAWPALSEVSEKKAAEEHAACLTKPAQELSARMVEAIRLATDLVVEGDENGEIHELDLGQAIPSGGATFNQSRFLGGMRACFPPWGLTDLNSKDPRNNTVHSVYTSFAEWSQKNFDSAVDWANHHSEIPDSQGNPASQAVKAILLTEPAKFRTISKGQGKTYFALKPLQSYLLRCWKTQTVGTMLHQDLTASLQDIYDRTPADWLWHSVDYKSATDLLKSQCGAEVLRRVQEKCDSGLRPYMELALRALKGGTVFYSKELNMEPITMTNGQLMGHPLSFPLLCIVNYACFLQTCKEMFGEDEDEFGSYMTCCLVNGDDMIFRGPPEMITLFEEISKEVGFMFSPGKNYSSRRWAMMNSQIFRTDHGVVVRHGYLNQRFLTGANLKTGDSEATMPGLSAGLNDMFRLLPWTRPAVDMVFDRFRDVNFGFTPNIFLPMALGGYGIDPRLFSDRKIRYTREQRRVAAFWIADPGRTLYVSRAEVATKPHALLKPLRRMLGSPVVSRHPPVAFRGIGPKQRYDGYTKENPWMGIVTALERASKPAALMDLVLVPVRTVIRSRRLKPMSVRGLERWRDCVVLYPKTSDPPPLLPIKISRGVPPKRVTPEDSEEAAWKFSLERLPCGPDDPDCWEW
jgi:hypothetical protein